MSIGILPWIAESVMILGSSCHRFVCFRKIHPQKVGIVTFWQKMTGGGIGGGRRRRVYASFLSIGIVRGITSRICLQQGWSLINAVEIARTFQSGPSDIPIISI